MKTTSTITSVLLGSLLMTLGGCCGQAEMQRKVKRSEAPANLDGIRTAEMAYHAMFDTYTAVGWTPAEIPGETPTAFAGGDDAGFSELGWTGYGDVYCRYRVTSVVSDEKDLSNDSFEAQVECYIDGDGEVARYVATQDQKATMATGDDVF